MAKVRKKPFLGVIVGGSIILYIVICYISGVGSGRFKEEEPMDVYLDMFKKIAIEFVETETDVHEKYGTDITLMIRRSTLNYEDEYAKNRKWYFSANDLQIETLEDFQENVEKMEFSVEVRKSQFQLSDGPVCVVTMIKDDSNNFIVSDWNWEVT